MKPINDHLHNPDPVLRTQINPDRIHPKNRLLWRESTMLPAAGLRTPCGWTDKGWTPRIPHLGPCRTAEKQVLGWLSGGSGLIGSPTWQSQTCRVWEFLDFLFGTNHHARGFTNRSKHQHRPIRFPGQGSPERVHQSLRTHPDHPRLKDSGHPDHLRHTQTIHGH